MCDHVIIIHRGRIAATGSPEELKAKYARTGDVLLEAEGPQDRIEEVLLAIEGVVSVKRRLEEGRSVFRIETRPQTDVRAVLSRRLCERGWPILELHRRAASLEDIFVSITMREE